MCLRIQISPNKRQLAVHLPHALAILAVLSTGCGGQAGPERVAVNGTVTLDGQPLPAGTIRFIPTGSSEGPAAVGVIADGVYKLKRAEGPVLGTQRVEIEATDHYGFAIDDELAFVEHVEQKGRRMPVNPVPATYNARSTLTADVSPDGPHAFNFPLTSEVPAKGIR